MRYIVGVGDMWTSSTGGDLLVTYALGSCLGITAHDPAARIGGLLHVMLPTLSLNPEKAKAHPAMFVDTGVAAMLDQMLSAGAVKSRLVIKAVGGAALNGSCGDRFAIGKRNYLMLKKVLWQHDLLLGAEDVGGESPRSMHLEIGSGACC